MLRNAVGGVSFPGKKRYDGVRCNVISVTGLWVGVSFLGKKRYVTPLNDPYDKMCIKTDKLNHSCQLLAPGRVLSTCRNAVFHLRCDRTLGLSSTRLQRGIDRGVVERRPGMLWRFVSQAHRL